ncbi:MAG: hypothetical protein IPH44_19690 [Myxococcales bacterium]|nr:hypothetical protein [Myxococcales bacterium]MBK7195072.1 hypothetical protein [Myxococcales bacterium]MBP6848521.1 hypothetical protein [Kofleriaceae bacterium]
MPNSTIERRAPRRLLGALMMALVAPTACGGGDGPAGGPDATALDAPTAPDASTAPDAPAGGCSASDLAACAYDPPGDYAELPVILRDVTYTDVSGQSRTVEIALHRPSGAPQPWPVVIWSHGGADGTTSAVNVGAEWGRAFTAAGYLFIGIAHRGRDQASREQMCTHFGVPLTIECAQVKYLHWDRPNDLREVVDYLEAQATGPLAGVADLDKLLYAGHSAGSGGGSIVAGASRLIYGGARTAPDPRPKAFIGASMEGEGDDGFTADSFRPIARPHLTLSGVGDTTPEATAPPRRVPFEVMMPGDKYRLWITELAARHTSFNHEEQSCRDFQTSNGGDVARCAAYTAWVESAALAFADAQLRDRAEAHAWLASDNLTIASGGAAEWARR